MASFPTDATYVFDSITYSMNNRKPDRGFGIDQIFNTGIFTSQIGYEKRRQISRRSKRKFSISYTNLHGAYKTALENFYRNRGGDAEAFEFDLSYVGLVGIISVRFDGSLQISEVLSSASELDSFYNVRFTLQETFS
jgi:hypothetical protein